jgi:hypothetical protein
VIETSVGSAEKDAMSDKMKAAWAVNGLLAVIFVLLAGHYWNTPATPAYAVGGGWETNGIMAGTALDTERIILVDTTTKNIMIYKIIGNSFRLVGARAYDYDVLIEDSAGTPIERGTGATWRNVRDLWNSAKK